MNSYKRVLLLAKISRMPDLLFSSLDIILLLRVSVNGLLLYIPHLWFTQTLPAGRRSVAFR